jgi:hypothetical protein
VTATSTLGHSAQVTIAESCAVTGTTEARCMGTVGISVDGTSTQTTMPVTISGTGFHMFEVAVTGGADKTAAAAATDACKASGNAAAGTSANVVRVGAVAAVVGLLGVVAL